MVLWCLLSGRIHAWADANGRVPLNVAANISERVRRGERPDCHAVRPDAPWQVVNLMKSAWSHAPAARPSALHASRLLHQVAAPVVAGYEPDALEVAAPPHAAIVLREDV